MTISMLLGKKVEIDWNFVGKGGKIVPVPGNSAPDSCGQSAGTDCKDTRFPPTPPTNPKIYHRFHPINGQGTIHEVGWSASY
jgi:hypothetical protein